MKHFIYFLYFITFSLSAIIIESDDITTIMAHICNTTSHQEVLVVFDIDNTLIHATDGFGGDEWFSAMIQKEIVAGNTIHMALEQVLPLYYEIQNKIWLDLIQPETARMITFLQSAQVPLIALTSRSTPIKDRTRAQLIHVNIDFSHTAPHNQTLTFDIHHEAYYERGILFSANHNKGDVLVHFFDIINYHPKKVIFVDDKLKYVQQVESALTRAGIECIAIRYSRLDQKVKEYNRVVLI